MTMEISSTEDINISEIGDRLLHAVLEPDRIIFGVLEDLPPADLEAIDGFSRMVLKRAENG